MIGKTGLQKIIRTVMREATADETEVILMNTDTSLTRFANNHIHQNVQESNTAVAIRSCFGKKIGSASTNSLTPAKLKEVVHWAEAIARHQVDHPAFGGLPKRASYRPVRSYSPATARFGPALRAEDVRSIIDVATGSGLTAFGSLSGGVSEIVIANSHGLFAFARTSDVFCNVVMSSDDSTGYAQAGATDPSGVDCRKLARVAADKALGSRQPVALEPGPYTTIFEPLAVQDLVGYMAHYAFNGRMFEEGRSFLKDKLGKQVVDQRITLVDDPFTARGFAFPFDFEGVPKRRLVLIDKGVARNVVYDTMTATRYGRRTTGHSLTNPNPFGPVPIHLVMKGGDQSLGEMIRSTKKGVLVTRLHYTNVIDPYRLSITGMTRDGTFLIEGGRITRGVKNLRFTDSLFEVFNRVESIGRHVPLVAGEPGYGHRFPTGSCVPAVKIRDFAFTSATEF